MAQSGPWNWQLPDWPSFCYDDADLHELMQQYQRLSGVIDGSMHHLDPAQHSEVQVHLLRDEAIETSAIAGEALDRASVQSSLRRHFNLHTTDARIPVAERGIANMLVDMLDSYAQPLSHSTLYRWHEQLMLGRRDIATVGAYRKHPEPMHFEASPSERVPAEMQKFIDWYNGSAPGEAYPVPVLERAAIAHLYFVSIHPFEDGNGRIGRALVQKVLAQHEARPVVIAIAQTIVKKKKAYYAELDANTKSPEVGSWMQYFAAVIIDALQRTIDQVRFVIEQGKLYHRLEGKFNVRQSKALERIFREGIEGFDGGLSAGNYRSIAKTSKATATRDLQELVELGALRRTGERKHTRYYLNIDVE